jgi:hypothetical protein
MTNEELDNARAEEAWNIYNRERKGDVSAIAARLAREGWTPPVPVDPDLAEAEKLWELWGHSKGNYLALKAIKRGRELERAVMGNPIPEQIQEVTPPEPVNPDLAEAEKIRGAWEDDILEEVIDVALAAIKRGRALAAAEAKSGLVWVKHDGSTICPVDRDAWVLTKNFGYTPCFSMGKRLAWQTVTHYAIITPPEDVA